MGYVIAFLVLLGIVIAIVEWLWALLKAIVSAIWIPTAVVAGALVLWYFVNYLIERYVSTKSEVYPKIKELYNRTKALSKPVNIDLQKNPICLQAQELPEEVFFVEQHSTIQSQLDLIKSNYENYEKIRNEKENILQEENAVASKALFENYVINRYARKIINIINGMPDTFKAKVIFTQNGESKKVQYSFNEIADYNSRYNELEKSLQEKRRIQQEKEEKQKRDIEEKKKAEQALARMLKREEERRKEAIKRERSKVSPSLRYDVMRRDGFRCVICGRGQKDGVKLHVDHIKPVSKGGKTEFSNLRTLCDECNLGKSDKYDPHGLN